MIVSFCFCVCGLRRHQTPFDPKEINKPDDAVSLSHENYFTPKLSLVKRQTPEYNLGHGTDISQRNCRKSRKESVA